MDANEVAGYLRNHPEFFDQYAELLAQISIPSPHGGKAVSITERQMGSLREKIRQLEAKLVELIRFGEENDVIAGKVHRLALALLGGEDLAAVTRSAYSHLGGDFAVPHVVLRVWGRQGDGVEFTPVDEALRLAAEAMQHPYCGAAAGQAAVAWLGDAGGHVRSVAQLALRTPATAGGHCFGLLLLASEEAHRFYPEMGTLYLQQIGDLVAAALHRVLD